MKTEAFAASGSLLRFMPSPRAVLADIHQLKLDPTVAHTNVKASGRLRGHVEALVEHKAEEVKKEKVVVETKVEMKAEEVSKALEKAEKPAKAPKPPKKEAAKSEPAKEETTETKVEADVSEGQQP